MQRPQVLHTHDEPATNKAESIHNESYREEEDRMLTFEHFDVCEIL